MKSRPGTTNAGRRAECVGQVGTIQTSRSDSERRAFPGFIGGLPVLRIPIPTPSTCVQCRTPKEGMMSDKLLAALTALEKARTTALETAVAERQYRLCAVLDQDGLVQRAINRAHRLLQPDAKKK